MAGIISYGAHIPRMRLSPETANWPYDLARTAAYFDEDAVTMAVAAARDCLQGFNRETVDALFIASTSLPYAEKQSASLVAAASGLRLNILTVDVGSSLRAGTQALRLAIDAVEAGSARTALVVATDCRKNPPGSDLEREGGDAAVAFLVGREGVAAEIGRTVAVVNDILDVWRPDGERVLRSTTEDRFRFGQGYLHAIGAASTAYESATGRNLGTFASIAIYAPDARRYGEAIRELGLDAGRVVPMTGGAGSCGVACALLNLVQALESAAVGEEIAVLNYGDGADILAVRALEGLPALVRRRRSIDSMMMRGVAVGDYYEYLDWHGLGVHKGPPSTKLAPAPHALYRDQDEVVRFQGMRCLGCGMVQYPQQRVCVRCQAKDSSEPIYMAEDGTTLFSYSMDYVAQTPDLPLVHGLADFDVGGRAMMMVTDRDIAQIHIGMKLELVFRKFSEMDGVHTYLWKAAPAW